MRKLLSFLFAFIIIVSNVSYVSASSTKNGYETNTLFNFSSKSDSKKEMTDNKTKEEKINSPISQVLDIENSNVKRVIIKTTKLLNEKEQKDIVGSLGVFNRTLDSIIGFSAYLPEENISILEKNLLVKQVYVDNVVSALSVDNDLYLDTVSVSKVWSDINVKGSGVGVAVLDTGISTHSDLNSRIVAFKDFVNGNEFPYDDNGHGTSVAGIIGADGTYSGIAPDVNLIGVKVLDSNEQGYVSNVVAGIDWVIENKDIYNIKIINLSLGMKSNGSKDPLVEAVERAWYNGIIVVVAAGNTGVSGHITSPATSPVVISVGSTDTNGTGTPYDDTLSWFSVGTQYINGVKKPELFTPGNNIISTASTNGKKTISNPQNVVEGTYYKTSGTSMSAPVVSGTIALMLSADSNLNPNQIRTRLLENSINVNGLDILNVSSIFNIEPEWKDVGIIGESNNKDIFIENSPIDRKPIVNPVEENITDSNEESKNNNITVIEKEDNILLENQIKDSINNDNLVIEKPITNPVEKIYIDSIGNETNDKQKVDIEVDTPKLETTSTGKDFVYEVYENRTVLNKILNENVEYKNQEEVLDKSSKIEDIIYLFNYINRSFTTSDFDYFKDRIGK